MTDQIDTLEAVIAGRLTLTQAATQLGLAEAEVTRQLEMLTLAGTMARREVRKVKRRLGATLAGVAVLLATTSSVWFMYPAWAATCPQTLPAPMVMMCPNNPAKAIEVNDNFTALVTWLTAKTGTLSSPNITTAAVNATSVNATGTVKGKTLGANEGFELDWNKSGGTGETNFVNYKGQGPGGFTFYNGASNIGTLDNNGLLTTNAANFGTMNINNATITTVNGRRPAFMSMTSCNSNNCTTSCAPGVVKMAFGFHNTNGTNSNANGDFVCGNGNGFVWLGSCIGQTTCTVMTGCGVSSVVAECW